MLNFLSNAEGKALFDVFKQMTGGGKNLVLMLIQVDLEGQVSTHKSGQRLVPCQGEIDERAIEAFQEFFALLLKAGEKEQPCQEIRAKLSTLRSGHEEADRELQRAIVAQCSGLPFHDGRRVVKDEEEGKFLVKSANGLAAWNLSGAEGKALYEQSANLVEQETNIVREERALRKIIAFLQQCKGDEELMQARASCLLQAYNPKEAEQIVSFGEREGKVVFFVREEVDERDDKLPEGMTLPEGMRDVVILSFINEKELSSETDKLEPTDELESDAAAAPSKTPESEPTDESGVAETATSPETLPTTEPEPESKSESADVGTGAGGGGDKKG